MRKRKFNPAEENPLLVAFYTARASVCCRTTSSSRRHGPFLRGGSSPLVALTSLHYGCAFKKQL